MNPIYSIIIPVYNAEKYLESCIESVLTQSSASTFEVVLVNDGSRDGSAAICDRYAAQDPRFRAIHQPNQGVSVARNTGIAAATGQYVLFLDSDDLWDSKLLESLDRFLPQQPDMVEFGCCHFLHDQITATFPPTCVSNGESGEAYYELHEKTGGLPLVSACMAAFRRQFLLENDLRFPMGISYGEDFYFCTHCLKRAQSVYTVSEAMYRYRMNELSATHTPDLKKIRDLLSVSAGMYRLFPGTLLANYYCMRIWTIAGLNRENAKQLYGFLQENSDILQHITDKKARIACAFYKTLGWYDGAKLLRFLVDIRNHVKR